MYLNYEHFKDKIEDFEKGGLEKMPGFYVIEGGNLSRVEISEDLKDVSGKWDIGRIARKSTQDTT